MLPGSGVHPGKVFGVLLSFCGFPALAITAARVNEGRLRKWLFGVLCPLAVVLAFAPQPSSAQSPSDAWLRYAPLPPQQSARYASLPNAVVVLGDSEVLRSARAELSRGFQSMLGRTLQLASIPPRDGAIVLSTFADLRNAAPGLNPPASLATAATASPARDGFWLTRARIRGRDCLIITSPTDHGVLYGVFHLLSLIARNESLAQLSIIDQPYLPLRWVNQWDNLNGSIERGYGGPSIFFENGAVRRDLSRAADYARLLASLGINACAINNVNADPRILTPEFLPQLARIAAAFRPWGVRLALSVDVGSPRTVGGFATFDPLDPAVTAWWRQHVDHLYAAIPDFAGFVVKADSEGRVGPSAYNRTPADAANAIARALRPHGGVLFYRAFVYNHHLDWRDPKADRARAAYDIFHPLDGQFDDNVIIQIKNGPIDFQVREPVSPLFGGLERTNQAAELQVTQEYTGQQRHLCFLPTMWKEVLDFDLHAAPNAASATPVKNLIAGATFHRPFGGIAGVVNVGLDPTWLGHPLALANLYGFGRLAWNPNLDAKTIAAEWTRLTFGNDPVVDRTITEMLLSSWRTYEDYTGPLGAGTLTDIVGPHYGPGVESSERNGWGQWHRADHDGIGMDRTVATGTGFVGQYPTPVAQLYESLATTPDNLLLFFHHVPYTYVLHSGQTVIQYIYDSHYEGAARAAQYVRDWQSLRGHIDDALYASVLAKLEYQAGHAVVWRDAVCNWFLRTSGIADAKSRVGNYPNRVEAESMQLDGYVPVEVTPREDASGGKAIQCPRPEGCTASFHFIRPAGNYDLAIQYFDQNNGTSRFRLFVNNRIAAQWVANAHLPSTKLNADSSTRITVSNLALRPGDEIRIEGIPGAADSAALDYVSLHPASSPQH